MELAWAAVCLGERRRQAVSSMGLDMWKGGGSSGSREELGAQAMGGRKSTWQRGPAQEEGRSPASSEVPGQDPDLYVGTGLFIPLY